ncbi:MAG: SUMF1/EgtB/PvdO family nonheme iron enzyme [Paludibacteraceae bacterium]|nr:SUMF1/EgtB/PvdO family nonheme iron enzyme [Paludibacteraceae bacterium]
MHHRFLIIALLLLAQLPIGAKKKVRVPDSLQVITVTANGVELRMQRVEGGSFVMGATPEQYDRDTYTDKPAHLVFVSPYYIATTEVTNRLWQAVMPEREMLGPSGYPMHPVSFVSWTDAQEFVRRLDSLTGYPFRLPTEAEWEYAARGGERSKNYRFSGGHEADSVGWLYPLAGQWTHPVGRKHPNELGLYDMTGNVAEWCQDLYGPYQLSTEPDPCGADTGSLRIVRGGSYDQVKANSHLSVRKWYPPETSAGYIGLRVAFSLPDDPMRQEPPEEPELTQDIRLKGRKLHFSLVAGDEPYYLSDEITAAHWKKIMSLSAPDEEDGVAIGMSRPERERFAETCSRLAERPMAVASAGEVKKALEQGVIAPRPEKKSKKSVRATQRSRKTRDQLSPWAEMVGAKLSKPDDPILLQYKSVAEDNRPLRLVMRIKGRQL